MIIYLKSISFWIKFLIVGILLHFLLYNTVTFAIGFDFKFIRVWKEVLLIGFIFYLCYKFFLRGYIYLIFRDKIIIFLQLVFFILVFYTFCINYFVLDVSIVDYLISFRYVFLSYVILILFYHISNFITEKKFYDIIYFFGFVIKIILVVSVFWYGIIFVKPGVIDIFGYDDTVHTAEIGQAPPATFLTQIDHGFVRNQFLFERPIVFGFFLVAFFPLFYILYLRKRSIKKTWGWWVLYLFSIITTFSRAAWGAWFIELLIIGYIFLHKNIKKFLIYIIPVIIAFGSFIYIAYDDVVQRNRSTLGHFTKILKGIGLYGENWLFGLGAGMVGPASFWGNGLEYNPENQFLQVMIEFGVIGFILWFAIFGFLLYIGFKAYYKQNKKENSFYALILLALSIGIFGLTIEGMVLHSIVDRMIFYPFFAIFGLSLGFYFLQNNK